VSALSRDIGSGPYDFLQIDAAVNKGNSGGPTFNLEGEVVGVNTAIYSPSGGNVGIAFAVPAKTASDVIEQLRVNKTVSRGWLGVKIESVDEEKATTLGLNEPRGALVNEVTAGGPAASSTLRAGDVVLSVNDQQVDNSRDLARKIAEFSPGTTVSLEVSRYGKKEIVQVKLGTFPTDPQVAAQPKPETKAGEAAVASLGLTLGESPKGTKADGVAVRQVESGSDAAFKGIKVGDIIIEVQGQTVRSAKDVEDAVKKARGDGRKGVLLRVRQGETARFIAVQLRDE
jgi:serine protease Do